MLCFAAHLFYSIFQASGLREREREKERERERERESSTTDKTKQHQTKHIPTPQKKIHTNETFKAK